MIERSNLKSQCACQAKPRRLVIETDRMRNLGERKWRSLQDFYEKGLR